ncbi:MAG TPA: response regulator [Chloroflexota bacterium]
MDDSPADRQLAATMLESAGYRVRQAEGGVEGLKLARSQPIDVVLLDLMMPGMTGFDVLHELRRSAETSSLPVVVCTAKDLSYDERQELQGQVASIIQKRADMNDLLQELVHLERLHPALAQIVGGPSGHRVEGNFYPHLERELSRARRYGRAFSLVVARLEPNGQRAPGERDETAGLQRLCEELWKVLRRHDLVAHDGQEIFMLLPETDPPHLAALVDKLRANGGDISKRLVMGSASYPSDAQSIVELLQLARQRAGSSLAVSGADG